MRRPREAAELTVSQTQGFAALNFRRGCRSLMYPRATFVVLMLCIYAAFGGVTMWMGLSVQHAAVVVAAMLAVTGALWQRI